MEKGSKKRFLTKKKAQKEQKRLQKCEKYVNII